MSTTYEYADLDVEAEVLLTRAEWFAARKKFLALAGRDDSLYPPPVPTGYAWARRVTGFVNVDPLPQSVILPRGQTETPRTTIRWRLLFGDPASDAVFPLSAARPATEADPRDRVASPCPAGDLVSTQVYSRSSPPYFMGRPEEWVGRWLVNGVPRALALPAPVASYDDAAWRDTPWGRELAYALLPLRTVSGPYAGAATVMPFGGELDTDVALVRSPHPYLPASAVERQRAGPDAGGRTPVRTRAISYAGGRYHYPRSTPEGWLALRKRPNESSGFAGVVDDVVSAVTGVASNIGTSLTGAARNLGRVVTRGDLDALQALAAAAIATAVTGGVGLGLVGTTLQAASVAGSDDPWRAAARLGAVHYAFYASPLTRFATTASGAEHAVTQSYGGSATMAESLGEVRPGATEVSARTYSVAGMTVTADDIAAAEVWARRLVVAAPEEANAALQWLATQGGYIDLVFARLVIEAEADSQKRAALKARIAVQQAEWWRDYGQYIAAALSAVLTALGGGAIAAAGFALLSTLYQMGIQAATIESALDAQRRAELAADREVRALEAEIARLEAEIAALGLATPTEVTQSQGLTVTDEQTASTRGFEAWYAPIVRYWRGVGRRKS